MLLAGPSRPATTTASSYHTTASSCDTHRRPGGVRPMEISHQASPPLAGDALPRRWLDRLARVTPATLLACICVVLGLTTVFLSLEARQLRARLRETRLDVLSMRFGAFLPTVTGRLHPQSP